jgi:hypothetical protein
MWIGWSGLKGAEHVGDESPDQRGEAVEFRAVGHGRPSARTGCQAGTRSRRSTSAQRSATQG